MKHYDVIVVGAGFAGIGAAVSAARHGSKVLLVDEGGALGGATSNCLINPFMEYRTKIDGETKFLCDGIFREITERLAEKNAIDVIGIHFHTEYLKFVLDEMVKEAGVDVLFHTVFTDTVKNNDEIQYLNFVCRGVKYSFSADVYIDATGDANLAAASGCPFRLGREADSLCQPMTTCFRLCNIDTKKFVEEDWKTVTPLYNKLQEEGKILNPRDDVLIFKYIGEGVLHFNSTRIIKLNPTDAFDISRAEMDARVQIIELYNFMKENFESCKNAQLVSIAPSIGVRESRMIDGEYLLTGQDLLNLTVFDDAICAGNYDIDIHSPDGGGTSHNYFDEGTYYTIPYRALLPKKANNMLVAGRCISSDHEAQASYRILPIVCCIGQAAGTAASLAVKTKKTLREIDIKELQKTLVDDGCFIG